MQTRKDRRWCIQAIVAATVIGAAPAVTLANADAPRGSITNGGISTPIPICTPADFDIIRANLSGAYYLCQDIDMTGVAFDPIGDDTTPFTGELDGRGFTISNLTIGNCDPFASQYVGMFGFISGGTVTNLKLVDVDVSGDQSVGALAGWAVNGSSIRGCSATGFVTGRFEVGGLIGRTHMSDVDLCWTDVSVGRCEFGGVFLPGQWHGGLIGHIHPGCNVTESYALGPVFGDHSAGGFSGNVHGSLVDRCFAIGDASAQRGFAAGFTGYMQEEPGVKTRITNSWARGNASSDEFGTWFPGTFSLHSDGGFVGYMESNTEVEFCQAFGDVDSYLAVGGQVVFSGGMVGFTEPGSRVVGCVSHGDVVGTNSGGFAGWVEGTIRDSESHGNTRGNFETGAFAGALRVGVIESPDDGSIVNCRSYGNAHSDGILGNGHASPGHRFAGVGGMVGYMFPSATITDSEAHGTISGSGEFIGGFIGFFWQNTVERCASFGNVIADDRKSGGFIGGIRGAHNSAGHPGPSTIRDCYAHGDVVYVGGPSDHANNKGIAGLIGRVEKDPAGYATTIENCYSIGRVTSTDPDVGGLIGVITGSGGSATVTSSYWDTQASGIATSAAGVGHTTPAMQNAATFIGWDFVSVWDILSGTYPFLR